MEPIFQQDIPVTDSCVDRFGRMKPSAVLLFSQEVAGNHFNRISMSYEALAEKGMFWAISRQRLRISRMPRLGETLHLETWPMPNTRVAFPRNVVAYDESGLEVFRCLSLWVLVDMNTRTMIVPGKSGLLLPGTLRGDELANPTSLPLTVLGHFRYRPVCFTDLDRNGHMNNTKYLDWIDDLLPSAFHETHTPREYNICYISEAREGQELKMSWDFLENGALQVDAHRQKGEKEERIFAARILY